MIETAILFLFGFWLYIVLGALIMQTICIPASSKTEKLLVFFLWPIILMMGPFILLYMTLKDKA